MSDEQIEVKKDLFLDALGYPLYPKDYVFVPEGPLGIIQAINIDTKFVWVQVQRMPVYIEAYKSEELRLFTPLYISEKLKQLILVSPKEYRYLLEIDMSDTERVKAILSENQINNYSSVEGTTNQLEFRGDYLVFEALRVLTQNKIQAKFIDVPRPVHIPLLEFLLKVCMGYSIDNSEIPAILKQWNVDPVEFEQAEKLFCNIASGIIQGGYRYAKLRSEGTIK